MTAPDGQNSTFSERVDKLCQMAGGPGQLAEKSGLSRRVIDKYRNAESEPSRDRLIRLAEAGGVTVQWLATGAGMQPDPISSLCSDNCRITSKSARLDVSVSSRFSLASFARIPMFDVSAAAGQGAIVENELCNGFMALDENWIRRELGSQPENLAIIKACGNSMEPTIRSGDRLLIDMKTGQLVDGTMYVIHVNDGLVVKRIKLRINGNIDLLSDNQEFGCETISAKDQIQIAGKVLWVFKSFM